MPLRPFNREQQFLFPPNLDDWLPPEHAARFVASVIEQLTRADWLALGVEPEGAAEGNPAYAPQMLLAVWLYGFMTSIRSSRKLEIACRELVPFLWLTAGQRPDHNTLWRFYDGHREQFAHLFKHTVLTAVGSGLVDLALQAVDGTKIAGNAGRQWTRDAAGLERLMSRVDDAIVDLERQHRQDQTPAPMTLPEELRTKQALRERIQQARRQLEHEDRRAINLTDGDAVLVKGRQGIVTGYNAQAMASPLQPDVAGAAGQFLTAVDVVAEADDHAQLLPMLALAEDMTGRHSDVTLADGGYHSGANLQASGERGNTVMMPEAQRQAVKDPYHKQAFVYDQTSDSYRCPEGQRLAFVGLKARRGRDIKRIYRAPAAVCRRCPAFGRCTTNRRQGRTLEVGPHEQRLDQHRSWMATAAVKDVYRRRKVLIEPVFGVIKEQLGLRRWSVRGLGKVRAEWLFTATAFNLRVLWKVWARRLTAGLLGHPAAAAL